MGTKLGFERIRTAVCCTPFLRVIENDIHFLPHDRHLETAMSNMTDGMNDSDRTDAEEIAEIADASEIDERTDRRLVRCGDGTVTMTVSQFFGLVRDS